MHEAVVTRNRSHCLSRMASLTPIPGAFRKF